MPPFSYCVRSGGAYSYYMAARHSSRSLASDSESETHGSSLQSRSQLVDCFALAVVRGSMPKPRQRIPATSKPVNQGKLFMQMPTAEPPFVTTPS